MRKRNAKEAAKAQAKRRRGAPYKNSEQISDDKEEGDVHHRRKILRIFKKFFEERQFMNALTPGATRDMNKPHKSKVNNLKNDRDFFDKRLQQAQDDMKLLFNLGEPSATTWAPETSMDAI